MFKLDEESALGTQDTRNTKADECETKIRPDSTGASRARSSATTPARGAHQDASHSTAHRSDSRQRSKGYSLAAIGRVLSECGIPITTGALRAYVSEAQYGRGWEEQAQGQARPSESAEGDTAGSDEGESQGRGAAGRAPLEAKPVSASPSRAVDLNWDPAAPSDKASAEARASVQASPFARTKDL